MKIAIMPDSFKEGPDAFDIAKNIESGILSIDPNILTYNLPVSDGGDGLNNRIIHASSGKFVEVNSVDPLGNEIKTNYGVIDNTKIALVESALTCGISLIPKEKRDPTITTSYGLGMVLDKVISDGYKDIVIGLGASGTNDAGVGMLQAMGVSFKDKDNEEIGFGGLDLKRIKYINYSKLNDKISNLRIKVACNPSSILCGPNSTSLVYSRQKGATEKQSFKLDSSLFHFGMITNKYTSKDVRYLPGSGGAGGIGASLNAYLGAELIHSVEIIKEYLPLEDRIKNADIVISAEGRFDETSLNGKIVGEIAKIAHEYNKPFFVLCGQMPKNLEFSYKLVDGAFSILNEPSDLETSINHTLRNIKQTAASLTKTYFSLLNLGGYHD